ncbi:hypothetical protein [Arcanobacterium buesumense]|uniref:Scaffolding protein n=1 Tax=Arcanobacterium buesumense TaxID=2722751 RepID=A0A6H2ELR5_9ACTO|nr:hypothetical protein [Arcanobacterium buesumense]QJC22014.1 hypothetical protein HC352_05525 [Arcanobacterium buesumense]
MAENTAVEEEVKPAEVDGAKPEETVEDEFLGDAGKAALKKEREANKANAKRIAELESLLRESENASKSEEEKTRERLTALEQSLEAERRQKELLEASNSTGVPVELLAGPQDDLTAYAQALLDWQKKQASEPADDPRHPVPSLSQRPEHSGAVSIDEQIRAAVEAGDKATVSMLKALKLGKQ